MISPRLRAVATLVAVFACGAATGAAVMRYTASRSIHHLLDAPPTEARRRAMVWAIDRKLSLSSEQRDRIEAILAAHSGEFTAIALRTEPQLAPLMAQVESEIRATLTPDQQPKFDALATKFKERRRRALGVGAARAPRWRGSARDAHVERLHDVAALPALAHGAALDREVGRRQRRGHRRDDASPGLVARRAARRRARVTTRVDPRARVELIGVDADLHGAAGGGGGAAALVLVAPPAGGGEGERDGGEEAEGEAASMRGAHGPGG